jgi:2-desacetyl-2-hydroxyethyl bacteriochlorophyllide A dehydrogenase
MQEHVCVPVNRVYRLPARISLEEGALIEPLAVAYHTVRQAGDAGGEPVLVLGAGAIGILIAQVWRALGCGYAAVVEIDPKRVEVAAQLGIPVWDKDPRESSFSKIFEATGSTQAFSKWLPALAPRGVAIVVSKLAGQATMDWLGLLRKEGGIKTSRYFTLADFETSISLVEDGAIQLQPLIGQIVPFRRLAVDGGVEVMRLAKESVRLLVRM